MESVKQKTGRKLRKIEFDILFVISFFTALFSAGYVFRFLPSPFQVNNIGYDILELILFMAYTILLGLAFLVIYHKLKPKVVKLSNLPLDVKRVFNTPNRVDRLEQELQSKDSFLTPNLEKILTQIANDYEHLDYKKISTIFTEIFKRISKLEEQVKNNPENEYPCEQCKKSFHAIRPDPTYSNPLRDNCSVCDMLNRPVFKRWNYPCDCGHINFIYWHHKDGHTQSEIQMAEKMFYESE